jgi:hypothetical protein
MKLYIDLNKALVTPSPKAGGGAKPFSGKEASGGAKASAKLPAPPGGAKTSGGGSTVEYEYAPKGPKPGGDGWIHTDGEGWKRPKGSGGGPGAKEEDTPKETGDPATDESAGRQTTTDPFSPNPDDFASDDPFAHYKHLKAHKESEGVDPKLTQMHHDMLAEKTKDFGSAEHSDLATKLQGIGMDDEAAKHTTLADTINAQRAMNTPPDVGPEDPKVRKAKDKHTKAAKDLESHEAQVGELDRQVGEHSRNAEAAETAAKKASEKAHNAGEAKNAAAKDLADAHKNLEDANKENEATHKERWETVVAEAARKEQDAGSAVEAAAKSKDEKKAAADQAHEELNRELQAHKAKLSAAADSKVQKAEKAWVGAAKNLKSAEEEKAKLDASSKGIKDRITDIRKIELPQKKAELAELKAKESKKAASKKGKKDGSVNLQEAGNDNASNAKKISELEAGVKKLKEEQRTLTAKQPGLDKEIEKATEAHKKAQTAHDEAQDTHAKATKASEDLKSTDKDPPDSPATKALKTKAQEAGVAFGKAEQEHKTATKAHEAAKKEHATTKERATSAKVVDSTKVASAKKAVDTAKEKHSKADKEHKAAVGEDKKATKEHESALKAVETAKDKHAKAVGQTEDKKKKVSDAEQGVTTAQTPKEEGAPKEPKDPKQDKGKYKLSGAYHGGRAAGAAMGRAAADGEGSTGSIAASSVTYGTDGVIGAGHYLLKPKNKDAEKKPEDPKKPQQDLAKPATGKTP